MINQLARQTGRTTRYWPWEPVGPRGSTLTGAFMLAGFTPGVFAIDWLICR